MRKAFILLMSLAAMMTASLSAKAQEVTITLLPGCTWISYPNAEAMDVATALGDFVPTEGDIIKSQYSQAVYSNGQWIGRLRQFTPGLGYMYYSMRGEPVSFVFANSTPQSQVTVTTSEPMLITAISAMGGGEVTTNDGTYILVRGLCWATHENPTTNDDNFLEEGSGVGSFSATMTGLNWSTTYYVRAYAVTPSGTVYGEQQSFTTRDGIPTLTTDSITSITAISATSGGNITDNGGLNVTARGVCWSTSPNPTVSDSHTTNGTGTGIFTSNITGLEISTTYYVRAYATTNAGTAYGNELTFTTRDGIPTVTTAEVTDIQGETATCGGNVTDNCGLAVIARGVCWSTSPNPTLDDSHTTNGSGNGSFSGSITGLTISTTYYVRAYATTSAGTGYGEQVSFTTRNGIPTVTTVEVSQIQGLAATSGGNITDDGGLAVTARGVCWSTSPSPTLANSHTSNGSGAGSFSSYMTGLAMSTTYYVRAYATNSFVTVYGNQLSFTTTNDEHVYVDLGLPSGLLWATCNVGAETPEDYGDYFAWGETQPKDIYDWSTYQYCNGNYNTLTKYCNKSSYGYNGFTDNLTTLLPEDDAATANWGSGWRIPTEAEWQELLDNTTVTWTTQNGVNGCLFTASNGNSLFLPAAGTRWEGELYNAGLYCHYWSSSLGTDEPNFARLYSGDSDVGYGGRSNGFSVRPVRSISQNTTPIGAINGKFTINDNGDQVYFSQGNLQYQASTETWRFAENQWEYVGEDNSNISQTYDGWIDLFGWGTSGWNSGNTYYHPWDSNKSNSLYGPPGQYDLTGLYANADWGVYNPISNGGNQTDQWRTLTQPEWNYVFNTRTTTSGIRYAKANVNNVNGVILLPDDWSTSTYSLSNTNSSSASFSSNTLTDSEWSTLEQAGAVFLPAAGDRYGASVIRVGSDGYYWSASFNGSSYAYYVYFGDSYLYTGGSNRFDGRSVRLARVAE